MSSMFTTCPNCRMNLAVSAMDLRVGQGYVRCGRCERVFNALISLSEDLDREQQSGLAATGTTTVPALDEAAATEPAPQAPSNVTPIRPPPADDVEVVETLATGTFETIVLEGDGYLQTEEQVDERELDQQLREIADQIEADDFAHVRRELGVEEHTGENVVIEYANEEPAAEIEIDVAAAVGNPPPRHHWGWAAAAGALLVLLAGQMVHHGRQSLVSHAWLERPLQAVYGLFGVKLEPKWDLKAYDLRQLGGEALAGTATTVVLKASIHNRSRNSQPPPMIRAVLQDRFGNALSTTAVAPQDYLRGPAPARMNPDQRLDGELQLEDPHRQAVGFELDACLPGADRKLHCSNDP